MKHIISAAALLVCAAGASAAPAYSNLPGTGDAYVSGLPNPGGTQALTNAPGWYYNNVRNAGSVGINVVNPRSGNGSASFISTNGNDKADIEYYEGAAVGSATAIMGRLGDVTSAGFDWIRNSGQQNQHASMRLLIDADGDMTTTNDRGALIFEHAYNGPNVADGVWTTESLVGASVLWQSAVGLGTHDTFPNFQPLSVWGSPSGYMPTDGGRLFNANSAIYGLSLGVGSGFNVPFVGAVDNVYITFGSGYSLNANFEVVPSPAAAGLLGLGALAAARRRRSI
ncbi:hypothetical protein BH11PLA1_BH11PLA1_24190 [soil metagenome]